MPKEKYKLITREDEERYYTKNSKWVKDLIRIAANRILFDMSDEEIDCVNSAFFEKVQAFGKRTLLNEEWRQLLSDVMIKEYPEVLNAFLAAHKEENAKYYEEICAEMSKLVKSGDQSNGSVDSSLTSSKRALIVDAIEKVTYRNYHLTNEQKEAYNTGYIYVHDMGHRRDSINCCLFDMQKVLDNGFEMGEMWYEEPKTLQEAFDVIGNVSLNAAAQIYGGFTIPQIDELLVKYAYKSFAVYV